MKWGHGYMPQNPVAVRWQGGRVRLVPIYRTRASRRAGFASVLAFLTGLVVGFLVSRMLP